jgi:hypothetical protein
VEFEPPSSAVANDLNTRDVCGITVHHELKLVAKGVDKMIDA